MQYSEAISFIHSVSNFFCKPGLSRIKALCEYLGNPQDKLKFIHIAGTNGKGSLCAALAQILQYSGLKTGLYTSPFIIRFNERIQINSKDIPDAALAEICEQVKEFCDKTEDKPTEFEVITAIAFQYFYKNGCDIVVLECGLGGLLDATNIIKTPLLSVITEIDFDHTAFLGDTIEKIASEKAGIIKPGVPCLYCGKSDAAYSVIKQKATSLGSPIYREEHKTLKILKSDLTSTIFDFGGFEKLEIRLLGSYQPYNTANALRAALILRDCGFNITDKNIRVGLFETRWRARFEKLSDNPAVIFDGAHNPQGITAALKSIKHYFGEKKVYILTGVMKDKDYSFIASSLSGVAAEVFCVTPQNPRALQAEEYAEIFKSLGISAYTYGSIPAALSSAYKKAKENQIPLICLGSLYMYSDIFSLFE